MWPVADGRGVISPIGFHRGRNGLCGPFPVRCSCRSKRPDFRPSPHTSPRVVREPSGWWRSRCGAPGRCRGGFSPRLAGSGSRSRPVPGHGGRCGVLPAWPISCRPGPTRVRLRSNLAIVLTMSGPAASRRIRVNSAASTWACSAFQSLDRSKTKQSKTPHRQNNAQQPQKTHTRALP